MSDNKNDFGFPSDHYYKDHTKKEIQALPDYQFVQVKKLTKDEKYDVDEAVDPVRDKGLLGFIELKDD